LQHRLKINEHVRGLSFYVPVDPMLGEGR
jgi:hypothetical protein